MIAILIIIITIFFFWKIIPASLSYVKPKILNQPKFQFKIVPTWFGGGYVTFKFSNDYGASWKHILREGSDFCNALADHFAKPVAYKLGNGNFDAEKIRFDSYEKCIEHNNKVIEKVKNSNISLKNQRLQRNENLKNAWERANS